MNYWRKHVALKAKNRERKRRLLQGATEIESFERRMFCMGVNSDDGELDRARAMRHEAQRIMI